MYRFEASGALSGLTRVRGFTQDDAHLFVRPDQLKVEVTKVLEFVLSLLRDFGLTDFELELSMRDDEKSKWIGSDEFWEMSTGALRDVALASGLKLTEVPGEGGVLRAEDRPQDEGRARAHVAALHGPDRPEPSGALRPRVRRLGRQQAATDHDPPRAHGLDRAILRDPPRALRGGVPGVARARPGRARAGRGPPPRLPHGGRGAAPRPRASGSRSTTRASGCRRRSGMHPLEKVPYVLIAGDADEAAGTVSFRFRDGTQDNGVPRAEAVARIAGSGRGRRSSRGHARRSARRLRRVGVSGRRAVVEVRRRAGRVPAAVDAAPDRVHRAGADALAGRVPVLSRAGPARRRGAHRRAR